MLAQAARAMGVSPEQFSERRERWNHEHHKLVVDLRAAEAKALVGEAIDPLTLCVATRSDAAGYDLRGRDSHASSARWAAPDVD